MMKKGKLSFKEIMMICLLVVLLIGVGYYMLFYAPLQQELSSIRNAASDVDAQTTTAIAKLGRMKTMQEELDEILARPAGELTEIAPYDNKEVVMNQLHAILASQTEYFSLNHAEPKIGDDGTVRRNITMSFGCKDYASAKRVIHDLTNSQWRCLVSNLVISGNGGNVMGNTVSVSATITFFEHTALAE